MSLPDDYEVDLLKKKSKFFSEIYEKFDESEISKYRNTYNKFWSKAYKLADFQKELDALRAEGDSNQKYLRKMRVFFFLAMAIFVISNYIYDRSSIEGGLILFSFVAFFGWIFLVSHISETARLNEISNLNRFILLLRSDLYECRSVDFWFVEKYIKIMQSNGFNSASLTEDEQSTLQKVNIDLNISIIESMGYEIPTFYDSFDQK